jgi:predicted short-subunit dehydrogenase-like oxidoreductase (DUF2520 family)
MFMKIVFIGSGNVAHFLAHQFAAAGHHITMVISKTIAHAQKLARLHNCDSSTDLVDLPAEVDLVCICVPDDAIAKLDFKTTGLVVHCSGASDIEMLSQFSSAYGCIWPVASISEHTAAHMQDVSICISANTSNVMEILMSLCLPFAKNVIPLTEEQKRYAHLVATIGNNLCNHLLGKAHNICFERNLDPEMFTQLFQQPANYFLQGSNHTLQTGPARRGDTNTLEMHSVLLSQDEATLKLYKTISASIEQDYK